MILPKRQVIIAIPIKAVVFYLQVRIAHVSISHERGIIHSSSRKTLDDIIPKKDIR